MLTIDDWRTEEQKTRLTFGMAFTDANLSGGEVPRNARKSIVCFAFDPRFVSERDVLLWAYNRHRRGELQRPRLVKLEDYRPKGDVHLTIRIFPRKVWEPVAYPNGGLAGGRWVKVD